MPTDPAKGCVSQLFKNITPLKIIIEKEGEIILNNRNLKKILLKMPKR